MTSWPGWAVAGPPGEVATGVATGSVHGTVAFPPNVAIPEPRTVANTTDPELCGEVMGLEDLVVSRDRRLVHVVVALTNVPADAIPADGDERPPTVVLDNAHCQFRPRVLTLGSGDALLMHNSDSLLHTVHLYGPTEMNVALPTAGMEVKRRLTEPGIYQVRCDVHGWMRAFVRVDPHRFHAVTGPDGSFLIESVPAGDYTLEAWHERLGFLRREVSVESGAPARVELTYPASSARRD